jgi:hypothetical protein
MSLKCFTSDLRRFEFALNSLKQLHEPLILFYYIFSNKANGRQPGKKTNHSSRETARHPPPKAEHHGRHS